MKIDMPLKKETETKLVGSCFCMQYFSLSFQLESNRETNTKYEKKIWVFCGFCLFSLLFLFHYLYFKFSYSFIHSSKSFVFCYFVSSKKWVKNENKNGNNKSSYKNDAESICWCLVKKVTVKGVKFKCVHLCVSLCACVHIHRH